MSVLVICDKEKKFVEILAEYMRRKFKLNMEIEAYDNPEKLLQISGAKKIGLCLLGEGMMDSCQTEQLLLKAEQILFISSKRKKDRIFKYQSVEQVMKDILRLCEEKEIPFLEHCSFWSESRQVKIISFYSPARHLMQSSLALTMGQILAREKKVLYLNFEPYAGFEKMMEKKFCHDFTELFLYLQESREKFRLRLESLTESVGGLFYLPPVFCFSDMEEIGEAAWKRLLQRIINETEYEIVILDLTEQVQGLFSLLEASDVIYTCYSEEKMAAGKMEHYERLLAHMKKDQILEKTKKYAAPVFVQVPETAAMLRYSELEHYVKTMMSETESEDGRVRGKERTDSKTPV